MNSETNGFKNLSSDESDGCNRLKDEESHVVDNIYSIYQSIVIMTNTINEVALDMEKIMIQFLLPKQVSPSS